VHLIAHGARRRQSATTLGQTGLRCFDRIWTYAATHGIDSWLALDDDDWMSPEYARWRLIKLSSSDGVSGGAVDFAAYMLRALGGGSR
jgi:hypothetical protein